MARDYLPKPDALFVAWYENFVTKLPTYTALLSISAEQLSELQERYEDSKRKLSESLSLKTTYQSKIKEKNSVFDMAENIIRDVVVTMKRNKYFTLAIGEDLGVIPPEAPITKGSPDAKPEFQTTVLPDKIRLDWLKREYDGVVIRSKRGAESVLSHLDKDTMSPYEDTRKNLVPDVPEKRIFQMRYLLGDEEIGLWSDEVQVVCWI